MEKFEEKEKLASAKLNKLVDELNGNTKNLVTLSSKIGAMQTSLDKADAIYDDYINAQELM